MLRKCIFHQPAIPCDTLRRLISCLMSTDVTQLFLHSVLSFNRSRKIRNFPKSVTFLILDGCLQPCRLVYVPRFR